MRGPMNSLDRKPQALLDTLSAMPNKPVAATSPRSLTGLGPFLRPYRGRIALAALFLVMAAVATLVFPVALGGLIDGGLSNANKGEQLLALRQHFLLLFGVAVALGMFS